MFELVKEITAPHLYGRPSIASYFVAIDDNHCQGCIEKLTPLQDRLEEIKDYLASKYAVFILV